MVRLDAHVEDQKYSVHGRGAGYLGIVDPSAPSSDDVAAYRRRMDEWRDACIDMHHKIAHYLPLDLALVNRGSRAAQGIQVEINAREGCQLAQDDDVPEMPDEPDKPKGLIGSLVPMSFPRNLGAHLAPKPEFRLADDDSRALARIDVLGDDLQHDFERIWVQVDPDADIAVVQLRVRETSGHGKVDATVSIHISRSENEAEAGDGIA